VLTLDADTKNGFISVEAVSDVLVQAVAFGSDGHLPSGSMPLDRFKPHRLRTCYPMRPEEAIYIGCLTFSIVPEAHKDIRSPSSEPTSSCFESNTEHVSPMQKSLLRPDLLVTPPAARLVSSPRRSPAGTCHQTQTHIGPAFKGGNDEAANSSDVIPDSERKAVPPSQPPAFQSAPCQTIPEVLSNRPQRTDTSHRAPKRNLQDSVDLETAEAFLSNDEMIDDELTDYPEDLRDPIASEPQCETIVTENHGMEMQPSPIKCELASQRDEVLQVPNREVREPSPTSSPAQPTQDSLAQIVQSGSFSGNKVQERDAISPVVRPTVTERLFRGRAPNMPKSPTKRVFHTQREGLQPAHNHRASEPSPASLPAPKSQDSLVGTIRVEGPSEPSVREPQTPAKADSTAKELEVAKTRAPSGIQAQELQIPGKVNSTGKEDPAKHESHASAIASPEEPSSSIRSTRSSIRVHSPNSAQTSNIKVVFTSSSSIGSSRQFKRFLNKSQVKTLDNVVDSTILCVGKSELKKTSKLIMAVLLGKEIVTDDWVIESAKAGKVLDIGQYLARDEEKEKEWGISLDKAIERGKHGVKAFEGWTIAFTQAAKKDVGKSGFDELRDIALHAGAKSVSSALPTKEPDGSPSTMIIAVLNDPSITTLKDGWRCFTRGIIGLTVLRGELDISSDEFEVKQGPVGAAKPAVEKNGGRKRKRTS